ncbi:MAG: hypothetical protein M1830_010210, partial [Pleopsidium flavum]
MIPRTASTIRRRRRCACLSDFAVYSLLLIGTVVVEAHSLRPDDVAKRWQQYSPENQQWTLRNSDDPPSASILSSEQQLPLINARNEAQPSITNASPTLFDTLPILLNALEVMQSHFFELWQGTWPRAIDWTAAVMGTHVSATLSTLTKSLDYPVPSAVSGCVNALSAEAEAHENLINRYFTQVTSFYFGENAFSLRNQAFDDMLWVVLGWLENIKFINLHSERHYASMTSSDPYNSSTWYAAQFIPAFAHRARLFYDLASQGWNTSLCGGGMIWTPYLTPYKNAITNELFIAASVSMYLYFPGDQNSSPFSAPESEESNHGIPAARPHDPKYLKAALEAYKWLSSSNMTNSQGLFTDGYHIRGWRGGRTNGTIGSGKCDLRNEMVYTYNQGVLLSGLRGLWESTGARSYLEDGHTLIRNVIAATGWHNRHTERRQRWAGLGRNGILQEACDASGMCSQDGQTFKGVFFHHLALFCAPLPTEAMTVGITSAAGREDWTLHERSCKGYVAWITHNARAAYATRDEDGVFGMWWGPGYRGPDGGDSDDSRNHEEDFHSGAVDYRNAGVPGDGIW